MSYAKYPWGMSPANINDCFSSSIANIVLTRAVLSCVSLRIDRGNNKPEEGSSDANSPKYILYNSKAGLLSNVKRIFPDDFVTVRSGPNSSQPPL